MTKRLLTNADEGLLKEVDALLGPREKRPLITKLERWRCGEYIPSERDGHGPGSSLSYPPGTAEQVVALIRELQGKRSLDRAALRLFLAPEHYWVGAKALRPAVRAELNRVRVSIERLAKTWRGVGGRPADPERTAMQLAERLVRGRVSTTVQRRRGLMLKRLGKPALSAEEGSSEDRLWSVFSFLIYIFLSGQLEPDFEVIAYQAFVAFGGDELITGLLPPGLTVEQFHARAGAFFSNDATSRKMAIVPDSVAARMFSLPHLAKTLKAMNTHGFERARDDCSLLVDLCTCLVRVLGALLPRDVVGRLSSLDAVDWPFVIAVAALPLLFDLRRHNAEALDANLAVARKHLPELREAFESGLQHDAFAEAAKREAILADTVRRTKESLQEDS